MEAERSKLGGQMNNFIGNCKLDFAINGKLIRSATQRQNVSEINNAYSYRRYRQVRSITEDCELRAVGFIRSWLVGHTETWEVVLENGLKIETGADCKVLGASGVKKIKELTIGSTIASIQLYRKQRTPPVLNPINILTEHWRPVPEFENLYLVSNQGRVKSLVTGRILKISLDWPAKDYVKYTLVKDKINHVRLAHRIVLETFNPTSERCDCRHLDGNSYNNDLSNLVWGSKIDNAQDKFKHGTNGRLVASQNPVREIIYKGINPVYRVEVAADNFVAGGIVIYQ